MFTNPKYNKPDENGVQTIDLIATHPVFGEIPFTASPNDPEPRGQAIYQNAKNGMYGEVEPYVEPEQPAEPSA